MKPDGPFPHARLLFGFVLCAVFFSAIEATQTLKFESLRERLKGTIPHFVFCFRDEKSGGLQVFREAKRKYSESYDTSLHTHVLFHEAFIEKSAQNPFYAFLELNQREGMFIWRDGYFHTYKGALDSDAISNMAVAYSASPMTHLSTESDLNSMAKTKQQVLCVGSSAAYDACLKAAHYWFPRFRFAYHNKSSTAENESASVTLNLFGEASPSSIKVSESRIGGAYVIAYIRETVNSKIHFVDDTNYAALLDTRFPTVVMISKDASSISPKAASFFSVVRGLLPDPKTVFMSMTLESKIGASLFPKNSRVPAFLLLHKNNPIQYSGALATSSFSMWVTNTWASLENTVKVLNDPSIDRIMQRAVRSHESGNHEEAEKLYLKVIKESPNYSLGHYNLGILYQQTGKLTEASEKFMASMKLDPYFTQLFLSLGDHHVSEKRFFFAIPTYRANIEVNPKHLDGHHFLAYSYHEAGFTEMATIHYELILRLNAKHIPAIEAYTLILSSESRNFPVVAAIYSEILKGNYVDSAQISRFALLCEDMKQYDEILSLYRKFLIPKSGNKMEYISTLNGIAERMVMVGQNSIALDLALIVYEDSPDYLNVYVSLGNAYSRLQQREKGIEMYRKGIALALERGDAGHTLAGLYSNLGQTLLFHGDFRSAHVELEKSLQLSPNSPITLNNLGMLHLYERNLTGAASIYERARAIDPKSTEILTNLAKVYTDLGRMDEALKILEDALLIEPSLDQARCDLAHGKIKHALHKGLEKDIKIAQHIVYVQLKLNIPVCLSPISSINFPFTPQEFLQIAQRHSQVVSTHAALRRSFTTMHRIRDSFRVAPNNEKTVSSILDANLVGLDTVPDSFNPSQIRVGFMSSDFRVHPVGFLISGLFSRMNRIHFNVRCYSLRASKDEIQEQIRQSCDHFQDISKVQSSEMIDLLRDEQLDILVDLNGHTEYARYEVLIQRVAPIQMTFLGFAGTTGAENMDYFVSDVIASPLESAPDYSEKLFLMPHSYMVNNHRDQFPRSITEARAQSPVRERFGLPPTNDEGFVFCNFNQHHKIDPQIFRVWMQILEKTPGSVLWLLKFKNPSHLNLINSAKELGISQERLVFLERQPMSEHLFIKSACDLFLDTPFYNGHSSGLDALWAGIPILTQPRDRMASRVGASLATALGVPEMIADTMDQYLEKAIRSARDPVYHTQLREKVERNRKTSPLFDLDRWIRNWESGLRAVFERHQSGLDPDMILIKDSGF